MKKRKLFQVKLNKFTVIKWAQIVLLCIVVVTDVHPLIVLMHCFFVATTHSRLGFIEGVKEVEDVHKDALERAVLSAKHHRELAIRLKDDNISLKNKILELESKL